MLPRFQWIAMAHPIAAFAASHVMWAAKPVGLWDPMSESWTDFTSKTDDLPFFLWIFPWNMVIFHSFLSISHVNVYQRVMRRTRISWFFVGWSLCQHSHYGLEPIRSFFEGMNMTRSRGFWRVLTHTHTWCKMLSIYIYMSNPQNYCNANLVLLLTTDRGRP